MISKKIKKLIWSFVFCLSSYFLLQLVKGNNRISLIGNISIYSYFLILHFLGFYFLTRKIFFKTKTIVIFVFIGSVISINLYNYFLPQKYEDCIITITALDEKNEDSKGSEVWLTEIQVNNHDYNIFDIDYDDKAWVYNKEFDRIYSTNGTLQINLKDLETIKFTFLKHPWSGKVLITFNNNDNYIDLFSKDEELETINFDGILKSNSNLQKSITFITFFATFFWCSMLTYGVIYLKCKKNIDNKYK